ncbi:MAG: VanW family protein [Fimbriimonadaceae bacterium]|nr:VanW family protein [Fimbriimonadaceae bacterium]
MKKAVGILCVPILGMGVALPMMASRHEPTIPPNTFIGNLPVGNLTRQEAEGRLKYWWSDQGQKDDVVLKSKFLPKGEFAAKPKELGVELDVVGTIASIPLRDFWGSLAPSGSGTTDVPLKFRYVEASTSALDKALASALPKPTPARVDWVAGQIVRKPEIGGLELDKDRLPEVLAQAMEQGRTAELPIKETDKHVPDDALDAIKEVVTEFSTKFPRNPPRTSNIKLASEILSGAVLMPGDTFSFNERVGRRTIARGFKVAGVYVNGRHDTGVGGGICQVSTTLYNAALFANLKILRRSNHSMPVAYVPVGRDATVDYGSLDLQFKNTLETPVAIAMQYEPGKLTARILGTKDPSLEVAIESSGRSSWARPEKVVHDASLPPGKTRVVEKGSGGHAVTTFRVVKKDGKVVVREPLGTSRYPGGPRIVARNANATVTPAPAPSGATRQTDPPTPAEQPAVTPVAPPAEAQVVRSGPAPARRAIGG